MQYGKHLHPLHGLLSLLCQRAKVEIWNNDAHSPIISLIYSNAAISLRGSNRCLDDHEDSLLCTLILLSLVFIRASQSSFEGHSLNCRALPSVTRIEAEFQPLHLRLLAQRFWCKLFISLSYTVFIFQPRVKPFPKYPNVGRSCCAFTSTCNRCGGGLAALMCYCSCSALLYKTCPGRQLNDR